MLVLLTSDDFQVSPSIGLIVWSIVSLVLTVGLVVLVVRWLVRTTPKRSDKSGRSLGRRRKQTTGSTD